MSLKDSILAEINRIIENKTKSGVFPRYALGKDVYRAVSDSLNELYSEGKIKVGKTLNDKWIEIVHENESSTPVG